MNQIIPFKTAEETLASLDNGGRFYNLLTKADDGNISTGELKKVAGLFSNKQQIALFYAVSTAELNASEKQKIDQALTSDLKIIISEYAPQVLSVAEAWFRGKVSSNAIVTGVAKLIEARSRFKGYAIIPVMTGKVITMIPVPLIDKYDVYELRDDESGEPVLIAHARGRDKLPQTKIKVAGVFKELQLESNESNTFFLEAIYFSEVV